MVVVGKQTQKNPESDINVKLIRLIHLGPINDSPFIHFSLILNKYLIEKSLRLECTNLHLNRAIVDGISTHNAFTCLKCRLTHI